MAGESDNSNQGYGSRHRLANALERLQPALLDGIYRSGHTSRRDFQLLRSSGYLVEIIQGWHHVSSPVSPPGATVWQGHYFPFVSQYLADRFDKGYCLSPEASLLLHAGVTSVPRQLTVMTLKASGATVKLPYGCSLLCYQEKGGLPKEIETISGIQVMPLVEALSRAPQGFFRCHHLQAASLLWEVRDLSPLLRKLLDRGASVFAGRLAGAFRHIGQNDFAERIISSFKASGVEISEVNPFDREVPILKRERIASPYIARIKLLWAEMSPIIKSVFPEEPGMPSDPAEYLERIKFLQDSDAYNSLSIEGYRVDDDLIRKIREGAFDPDKSESDRRTIDALAAKGYLEASKLVFQSIRRILGGGKASDIVLQDHHDWHQALIQPSVQAGIIMQSDLAGYRGHQVFIKNSSHVPLPSSAVIDAMEALFDLLESEPHAGVRAVLGHFIFVFIHPYGDGNGRLARFLMNAMLASGGHPWTIIHLDARDQYMSALESASVGGDIEPFARFVLSQMERTSMI